LALNQHSFVRDGCQSHRGKPLLYTCGNPKESELVTNVLVKNNKDGRHYRGHPDSALTPMELMNVKLTLISFLT
jgi:hypothetical protein